MADSENCGYTPVGLPTGSTEFTSLISLLDEVANSVQFFVNLDRQLSVRARVRVRMKVRVQGEGAG